MTKPLPTPATLRKLLRYEAETGKLFWRKRTPDMFKDGADGGSDATCASWNTRLSGKEAATTDDGKGYLFGRILGRMLRAHRVIWAMETGAWPVDEIDHINHIRDDNRFVNLREVTHQENHRNKSMCSTNTSGVTGVHWAIKEGKWRAKIVVSRKTIHLGYFSAKADAVSARNAAEIKYDFHENHE